MFLHIGDDVVVGLMRIIAILDLRTSGAAESTRELIRTAHAHHRIIDIGGPASKSAILTDSDLYLSPISSLTLKKRADLMRNGVVTDLAT